MVVESKGGAMARVPLVTQDDLPAEYQELIVSSLQPGKTVNVYRSVGNNPAVLSGLRSFLGSLWSDSGLSGYHRELVILTTSREIDGAYEWHQHVGIARGEGVDDEEILAIAREEYDAFDEPEATLLTYARAVVRDEVDDELHDRVSGRFENDAVVGIAGVASGYAVLGRMLHAFDVETEDEFVGWELENE